MYYIVIHVNIFMYIQQFWHEGHFLKLSIVIILAHAMVQQRKHIVKDDTLLSILVFFID